MFNKLLKKFIKLDRSISFGRNLIEKYLISSGNYKTVLDIGAGSGDDLLIARKINPAASLHAVECYPEYVQTLELQNIDVRSVNIEKESFPFENGSIDIVIINQVLEHTKEVYWIFHEISRVLTVGGKIIIGVPNLASLHNRLLLMFGFHPTPIKINSAHVRGFTKKDFLNFIQRCFPGGYQLKAFGGSNFYPFPPVIARPLARLFPTMAWGIFFVFEKKQPYKNQFIDFPITQKLETNYYVGT